MRVTGIEREPWERRWPDRETGPYVVVLQVGILEGRPAVLSVEMRGGDLDDLAAGFEPVTSTAIRLPVRELLDEYLAWRRRELARAPVSTFDDTEAVVALKAAVVRGQRRGGRPSLGPDHYRRVAEVYTAAQREGRKPTQAVREVFVVSPYTAPKWVSRARALGFLPPTTKGKSKAAPAKEEEM